MAVDRPRGFVVDQAMAVDCRRDVTIRSRTRAQRGSRDNERRKIAVERDFVNTGRCREGGRGEWRVAWGSGEGGRVG